MKGFVVLTLLLLLAGCGGDGGDNDVEMPPVEMPPEDDIVELQSDPRVMRLEGILDRADTLLVPSVHVRYSAPDLDETTLSQEITCSETTCSGTGVAFGPTELVDLSTKASVSEANLQSREDGFDTASIGGNLDASDIEELVPKITITDIPQGLGYGFWGEHGMAGLFLVDGQFSAQSGVISFVGDVTVAVPFVHGDASVTNPEGIGGATWTGIAEAISTRTFRQRSGTATLTIRDLSPPDSSPPTVTVEISIDGNPIDGLRGAPGWPGVPLADGRFVSGTVGTDYLEGNFYGVEHSETYGVFDTKTFTGAFGAKRNVASE